MNNNVENSVEKAFDEMLDSVKSINDDFINNYFEDDKIDKIIEEKAEKEDFYDEESLKQLSDDLNKELFENIEKVEKIVENLSKEKTDEDIFELIAKTDSSEEFFDILEGKLND